MSLGERFGENVKRARRSQGLSQTDLARMTELHRTQISNLERGHRAPRLETLVKLFCALEVPPAVLLDGMAWKPNLAAYGSLEIADD
jgi:transcriptional regulator with XRE-family HTH domain